jgi:hypothetical protein
MTESVINIIRTYLKNNEGKSNSEIAKLILEKSKKLAHYSEGTLKNYIAQVKELPVKTTSTTPGNLAKKKKPESVVTTRDFKEAAAQIDEEQKDLTIHDHIKGYIATFDDQSNTFIAKQMHEDGVGTEYSQGTLQNYIARNRKDMKEFDGKGVSNVEILKKSRKKEKEKATNIPNHEVMVIDQSFINRHDIQVYLDGLANNSNLYYTLTQFSENVQVLATRKQHKAGKDLNCDIYEEEDLGINLLAAISTTCRAVLKESPNDKVNLTIVTSGFDNQSSYLTYEDISEMLMRLRSEKQWNINLVFTGVRPEEAKDLAVKLGIDTSNLLIATRSQDVWTDMNRAAQKRVNKINSNETPVVAYY